MIIVTDLSKPSKPIQFKNHTCTYLAQTLSMFILWSVCFSQCQVQFWEKKIRPVHSGKGSIHLNYMRRWILFCVYDFSLWRQKVSIQYCQSLLLLSVQTLGATTLSKMTFSRMHLSIMGKIQRTLLLCLVLLYRASHFYNVECY